MAKTIRFPLEMANGAKVRTLEELRANFDVEKILNYYLDGRLCTWLNNADYSNESSEIKKIESNSVDFVDRLCDILGVKDNVEPKIDWVTFQKRNEKRLRLKNFTDDQKCFEKIDFAAFDQKDLDELIQTDANVIYLVSGNYSIPLDKENIIYNGIGNVSVDIDAGSRIDLERKNIKFQNIEIQNMKLDGKHFSAVGSEDYLKTKLQGIINDFQACRLEKEYLLPKVDYELDTAYDGSFRFDSEEEAEDAVGNRISRMHDEYLELIENSFDSELSVCLSGNLAWKYSVQIIKKFIDLKLQIKNLYEENHAQCPEMRLTAEANKKTMGRDEDGEFVSPCKIYLDFKQKKISSVEKSKLNLEIPANSSAKYSSDARPLFDNLCFGINEKILKGNDTYLRDLIAENQIRFNISADEYNEEYCYHINTELLLEDVDKRASGFADVVYSNEFIHQYFETMKINFAKNVEEEMNKEVKQVAVFGSILDKGSFNPFDNPIAKESWDSVFMKFGGIVL